MTLRRLIRWSLRAALAAGLVGMTVAMLLLLRFYERSGLIEEPSRRPSGYRQYPEAGLARLEFIRAAKELGFTLKEVEELLSLRVDPGATSGDVRRRADAKITEIEATIRT